MLKLLERTPLNGARSELLLKREVNCVFLLLILRPSPQKIVPELAKILEKYTWGDNNDAALRGLRYGFDKIILLIIKGFSCKFQTFYFIHRVCKLNQIIFCTGC